MKKRVVVTIYILVCGTVTVRLGIDKSVRDSKAGGPMTPKKKKKKRKKKSETKQQR